MRGCGCEPAKTSVGRFRCFFTVGPLLLLDLWLAVLIGPIILVQSLSNMLNGPIRKEDGERKAQTFECVCVCAVSVCEREFEKSLEQSQVARSLPLCYDFVLLSLAFFCGVVFVFLSCECTRARLRGVGVFVGCRGSVLIFLFLFLFSFCFALWLNPIRTSVKKKNAKEEEGQ